MSIVRSSALAIMLGACSVAALSASAYAQISISIRVDVAPPPLPFYDQPIIPAEGYLWAPGYWTWDDSEADYYWVPGTWVEAPQKDLLWTPAYWGWEDGKYVFYSGYWAPQVGFYGGVDYGYGYTGEGYAGGHWDHDAFFYNRAVNNISNVRITNVYNETIVVNNDRRNVSYNGGNGGTTVRPTEEQLAVAKARHIEPTPLQRQHAEAASKNRALFFKQNHGEPAVAATPRPGVFTGDGVSPATRTADTKENAGDAKKPDDATPKGAAPAKTENSDKPKDGDRKNPEKAAPANEVNPAPKKDTNKEPPKADEATKPEKPAPKLEPNKELPKAGEVAKPEKPSPKPEPNKAPPRADEVAKPEKPAPRPETNKEAPKAEDRKPERPAATMNKEAPRPDKPAPGAQKNAPKPGDEKKQD